jgi:hypothetical protein
MKLTILILATIFPILPALASEKPGRPVLEKGRRNSRLGIGQILQKLPASWIGRMELVRNSGNKVNALIHSAKIKRFINLGEIMARVMGFIILAALALQVNSIGKPTEDQGSLIPLSFTNEYMPKHFKTIISSTALKDSLKSINPSIRMAAAYRLGLLKDSTAVSFLKEAYETEPQRIVSVGEPYGFKYYALVAMGIIGGSEAEAYLCNLAHEGFFPPRKLSAAGDDRFDISTGIIDGISMLKSECAKDFLDKLIDGYEKGRLPNATLEIAYTARNRMDLLLTDSLKVITDVFNQYRDAIDSVENIKARADNKENHNKMDYRLWRTKQGALAINVVEIGIYRPDLLREYRLSLSPENGFAEKLDGLIRVANGWRSRLGK